MTGPDLVAYLVLVLAAAIVLIVVDPGEGGE